MTCSHVTDVVLLLRHRAAAKLEWRLQLSSAQHRRWSLLALCSRPHVAVWERLRGAAGRAVLGAILVVDLPACDMHVFQFTLRCSRQVQLLQLGTARPGCFQ